MTEQKMKRYEYPLKAGKNEYVGSYTIKEDAEPLGFKGEKLVQRFTMVVLAPEERLNEYESW